MEMLYRRLLLSELRCVILDGEETELKDASLLKAMTVNENLRSLGYVLRPKDVIRLSRNSALDGFFDSVKALSGDVKAAPMYPDFPSQVMEMEAAQFRFHQLLHYFSTYGLETLFGESVSRGWLPDEKGTPKNINDDTLLKANVLELLLPEDAYILPARRILSKRERMTDKEKQIIHEAAAMIPAHSFTEFSIPFKENLVQIFYLVFCDDTLDRQPILRALCQHTGDVLRCMDYALTRCGFHFRTSQKRFLVKLLESYPAADFETNLILSRKKAGRSLLMLQYLDYNQYSRSDAHKTAVASLRSGELQSWEGKAKFLLQSGIHGALDFIAQRPGMLLRMTAWLVRQGQSPDEIRRRLLKNADALSMQTLVTVLTYFGTEIPDITKEKKAEMDTVYSILEPVLLRKMQGLETPIHGKRVWLDMEKFDLVHSTLQCSRKSAEGGYIQSGIAYRIPEDIRCLRFFVYWNDKDRVDVDLHVSADTADGKTIHVGWNADFRRNGIVHSGDITHSDAAEYIDIDLKNAQHRTAIDRVYTNIHLYSGKPSFNDIEECYVGMMAVKQLNQNVKLYNPANCFFSHYLTGKCRQMHYGFIDVKNRCMIFTGEENDFGYYQQKAAVQSKMNLQIYLELLFKAQNTVPAQTPAEADVVLIMEKPLKDNEISLIDNNFFMEAYTDSHSKY